MWRAHTGQRQDTWGNYNYQEAGHGTRSHIAVGNLTELRYTFSTKAWHLLLTCLLLCTGVIPGPVLLWLSCGMFMASILVKLSELKLLENGRAVASAAGSPFATSWPHSGSAHNGTAVLLLPPGQGFLHVTMMDGIWGSETESDCHSTTIDILTEADLASLPTHIHTSDCHSCNLAPRNSFSIAYSNSNQGSSSGCHCHIANPRQHASLYGAMQCACTPDAAWSTGNYGSSSSSSSSSLDSGTAAAPASAPSSAGEVLLPFPVQTDCTIQHSPDSSRAAQQRLHASRNSTSGTSSPLLHSWPHSRGRNGGSSSSCCSPAAAAGTATVSGNGALTSCTGLAGSNAAADGAACCHEAIDNSSSSGDGGAASLPSCRLRRDRASSSSLDSLCEDKPMCAVCLENYKNGQLLTTLPCNHMFHRDCIYLWLLQQGKAATCPLCKAAVFW